MNKQLSQGRYEQINIIRQIYKTQVQLKWFCPLSDLFKFCPPSELFTSTQALHFNQKLLKSFIFGTLHKKLYDVTEIDIWPQIRRKQNQMRKANHKTDMTFINVKILKNKEHVHNCQTCHCIEVIAMKPFLHRKLSPREQNYPLQSTESPAWLDHMTVLPDKNGTTCFISTCIIKNITAVSERFSQIFESRNVPSDMFSWRKTNRFPAALLPARRN